MPNTSPNQKVIHIHRDMPDKDKKEGNFLLIKKANWYAANKDLEPYGLQLYLYIAGNKDGFDLALSQEAAKQEAGITKTTFHKYVNVLIEKGYLVPKQGNIFDFYEIPQKKKKEKGASVSQISNPSDKPVCLQGESASAQSDKEINNNTHFQDNDKYSETFIF